MWRLKILVLTTINFYKSESSLGLHNYDKIKGISKWRGWLTKCIFFEKSGTIPPRPR